MKDKDAHLMMEALREVENPFAGKDPAAALRAELENYFESDSQIKSDVFAIIDKHIGGFSGPRNPAQDAPYTPAPVDPSQGTFP